MQAGVIGNVSIADGLAERIHLPSAMQAGHKVALRARMNIIDGARIRCIGIPAPRFRVPALLEGRLVYVGLTTCEGRWTALCFLPYVSIVKPDFLDHQADCLDRIGTKLVVVTYGTWPLHLVWIGTTTSLRTPLLYDPLGRLHRSFGVPMVRMPVRCHTFLIDHAGLLRFHLIHDFTDRGLGALQEIVTLSQSQDTGGVAATDTIVDARKEVMNS